MMRRDDCVDIHFKGLARCLEKNEALFLGVFKPGVIVFTLVHILNQHWYSPAVQCIYLEVKPHTTNSK